MAFIIITGAMGLPVPTLPDPGPDFANNINACLAIISDHSHDGSEHGGRVIDLAQQVVNADLSINGFNLTNVESLRMLSQPSQLVGAQDVNSLYVNQNVLGFNNSNGIFVPIVEGNSLVINGLSFNNFTSRLVAASTSILPTDTYNLVNVNTATNAVTIGLPIAAAIVPIPTMRLYVIRDISDNAGTNNITLHCATGNTWGDSGSADFVISNNGGYAGIYTDGVSKWYTFTQNMYNSQVLKLVSSIIEQSAGAETKSNVATSYTGGSISLNGTSQTFKDALTIVQGSSIILMDDGPSDHSILDVTENSSVIFRDDAFLSLEVGSQTLMHGDTTMDGSMVIPSGGGVFVNTGGVINLNAAGNIQANANGAIGLLVPGAATIDAVSGLWSPIAAGIVVSAAPVGALSSGLALGGGNADYPCFTDDEGVSNPRSRSPWMPLLPLQMFSGWNVGGGNNWEGQNAGTMQITQIPVIHNGATLNSVTVLFNVTNPHASIAGMTFPRIQLWRQTVAIGQPSWFGNRQSLSTSSSQAYPTPPNAATYDNGFLTQTFTFTCNQNNVIDNSNFLYFLGIIDEQGGNAQPGNQYLAIQLNYSNIVDMRFAT